VVDDVAEEMEEDAAEDMGDDVVEDMTEDAGTWGLIWAAHGSCACDDDENVEDDAERCHTEDDGCDGDIDLQKIAGEGAGEKQERSLQHQRQRLHHMVEVPGDDTIEFALSVLAAFYRCPSHLGGGVPVQPLLAKYRKEGGEK
jgi:hypothetical protein